MTLSLSKGYKCIEKVPWLSHYTLKESKLKEKTIHDALENFI